MPDSWAKTITVPNDAQHSTHVLKMLFWQRLGNNSAYHITYCVYTLASRRHAFWHAQTLFPTSCCGWHNWSHNFSCLKFFLSQFCFIVPDRQWDKLNRLLLSRGIRDNESLKKVCQIFLLQDFPLYDRVCNTCTMDELWAIAQTGDSLDNLSSKAGNCPVNQRMRAVTMGDYLEHLSVPAIIIMKIYLNLVPRPQMHQQGLHCPSLTQDLYPLGLSSKFLPDKKNTEESHDRWLISYSHHTS